MLVAQRINNLQVLLAHTPEDCAGPHCALHNPSDHVMRDFPLYWRADRGMFERICLHGIGHPDPDDLAWKDAHIPDVERYAFGVHGCDGCCQTGGV